MQRKAPNFIPSTKKMEILKEHLVKKVPASDLSDKYKVAPSMIWSWQKLLFDNGYQLLDRKKSAKGSNSELRRRDAKIALLESKIKQKNEVIAELMQEHVDLKKKLSGES
jgi:hypothetical protein